VTYVLKQLGSLATVNYLLDNAVRAPARDVSCWTV